jgi:hypothetical protein
LPANKTYYNSSLLAWIRASAPHFISQDSPMRSETGRAVMNDVHKNEQVMWKTCLCPSSSLYVCVQKETKTFGTQNIFKTCKKQSCVRGDLHTSDCRTAL